MNHPGPDLRGLRPRPRLRTPRTSRVQVLGIDQKMDRRLQQGARGEPEVRKTGDARMVPLEPACGIVRRVVPRVPAARPLRRARHAPDGSRRTPPLTATPVLKTASRHDKPLMRLSLSLCAFTSRRRLRVRPLRDPLPPPASVARVARRRRDAARRRMRRRRGASALPVGRRAATPQAPPLDGAP